MCKNENGWCLLVGVALLKQISVLVKVGWKDTFRDPELLTTADPSLLYPLLWSFREVCAFFPVLMFLHALFFLS